MRDRLKKKRKQKQNSSKKNSKLPKNFGDISMFESAENLNEKMERMKAEMDKYLNQTTAPELHKKKKKKRI